MSQQLRYGYETRDPAARLFLEAPIDIVTRSREYRQAESVGEAALRSRCISVVQSDDAARLYVNPANIKKYQKTHPGLAREVVHTLAAVAEFAHFGDHDPRLNVLMGNDEINKTNRYAMSAIITWPKNVNEAKISARATVRMQRAAQALGYPGYGGHHVLRDMVFADVSRRHGVTIQTDPVGSCSLDTDGDHHRPAEPWFEVSAHNIYTAKQQLLCLYGAVAVATAAELA